MTREDWNDPATWEVRPGWYALIKRALDRLGPDVGIRQIKEKVGGLRIYIDNGCAMWTNIIREAELEASKTCEECGVTTPDVTRRAGYSWVQTLCDRHAQELEEDP